MQGPSSRANQRLRLSGCAIATAVVLAGAGAAFAQDQAQPPNRLAPLNDAITAPYNVVAPIAPTRARDTVFAPGGAVSSLPNQALAPGTEFHCDSQSATLVGTSGDEQLRGTPNPDVIAAREGNDLVYGHGSDDTICGHAGFDHLVGGPGDDYLDVGTSPPLTDEEQGCQTATGDGGDDVIVATSAGRQAFFCFFAGSKQYQGGEGDDRITGSDFEEVLAGGPGDDVLFGGGGNDLCIGGSGHDTYFACEEIEDDE